MSNFSPLCFEVILANMEIKNGYNPKNFYSCFSLSNLFSQFIKTNFLLTIKQITVMLLEQCKIWIKYEHELPLEN
jgi:hypothetical protein